MSKLYVKEINRCSECPVKHNGIVKGYFCSISDNHFEIKNIEILPDNCPLEDLPIRRAVSTDLFWR